MAMGEEAGSPAVLGEPDTPWGTVRGRGFGGGGGGGGGGDGAPVTGGGPRPSFYSDIFTSLWHLRQLLGVYPRDFKNSKISQQITATS